MDPRIIVEAFEGLPLSAAVVDRAGVIVCVNREWVHFTNQNAGHPGRCGVGASYFAVCNCNDPAAQQFGQGLQAVLAGAEPEFELEYPCHAPDEQRWFMARASPLRWASGVRVDGAVITHLNITARHIAEEECRMHIGQFDDLAACLERDLKEPLRGITRQIDRIAPRVPADAQEPLNTVRRLAAGSLKATDAMLDFAHRRQRKP
jgi:hypothetical protein